jgi:glyoxylase-like metal-dependent hydrolase (beta-lactamase superfamily II)
MKFQLFQLAVIACLAMVFAPPATAQESTRTITKVKGNLYRFREKSHYGIFYVTSAGVVVVDSINADTARWLKAQLRQRFNKEVKYLIYSHHHEDHVSGGEVFSDTAIIIAHDNAINGHNGQKVDTPLPDITFSDSLTFRLGDEQVNLHYAGLSHSDDSLTVHFPQYRAVYAADFVLAKALPFQDIPLWAYHYPAWLDSLHELQKMDFDILLTAHDQVGTHADVRSFRRYLEDLEAAVQSAIERGLSVEDMQNSISLEAYADWDMYDEWFKQNIKGMFRQLTTKPALNYSSEINPARSLPAGD